MCERASLFILGIAAMVVTGCATNERVLNPAVTTTPVVFESDQGRNAFTDAVRARWDEGGANIPSGKLSKNAYFNREIMNADLDGDGIISDQEAWRYIDQ